MSGQIAPIAGADVRRIAGAQVVPDMRAAVKELVENALDAKASSIGMWGLKLTQTYDLKIMALRP